MTAMDSPDCLSGSAPDLASMLDCLARLDGKVRVIVDRCGTVKACSANTLETEGSDASRTAKSPQFDGEGPAARRTVARLLAVRGEDTEIAVMAFAPGGQTVLVRAAAVDADHVYLVLATPGQCGSPRISELQKLFGLTACEAGIAKELMEGCAPQAIAARRRNSIHTIRAHIRQCHQKIGARNREEFFSRISFLYA